MTHIALNINCKGNIVDVQVCFERFLQLLHNGGATEVYATITDGDTLTTSRVTRRIPNRRIERERESREGETHAHN